MAINKSTPNRSKTGDHLNFEGGISFAINDPFTRLKIASTSCFFGEPTYYQDGDSKPNTSRRSYRDPEYNYADVYGALMPPEWYTKDTRTLMEDAIDACLDVDIERTLNFAVELRNEYHFRATPQVIMVRAAMHPGINGTGLIREYGLQIMSRLDEVMTQMAYFSQAFGNGKLRHIPSRLKRIWAKRLENADEYQIAKYKMTGRMVNIFDAINITHPKSAAIDHLMKGNLSLASEGIHTWESIRSAGGSWAEAKKFMGHMALLRNLRNLNENNEIDNATLDKLKNGVKNGKQFPFRYYAAFRAVEGNILQRRRNNRLLDTIEDCLEQSLDHLPMFDGKTLVVTDVSASMTDTSTSSMGTISYRDIAQLMAAITIRRCNEGGDICSFATRFDYDEVRRNSAVFDIVKLLKRHNNRLGCGTDIVKVFHDILINRRKYDTIFVYSDMQCGYCNLPVFAADNYSSDNLPTLLKEYRKHVNPNVQVFFVNLAGYQDTLMPEAYDRTYLLSGWSDKMLSYAAEMINITDNIAR